MVWKEKHRLSTNAWPTCLWNVTCPIVPSWVGWDASCLRNPQIWGLREQILHALCHQRLLRHSPRLLWGVCATGILTVSHQEQNKSILFPKLDILQKKIVVFLPLLFYTTVVFLIKGLAPLINKQKKMKKKKSFAEYSTTVIAWFILGQNGHTSDLKATYCKKIFLGEHAPRPPTFCTKSLFSSPNLKHLQLPLFEGCKSFCHLPPFSHASHGEWDLYLWSKCLMALIFILTVDIHCFTSRLLYFLTSACIINCTIINKIRHHQVLVLLTTAKHKIQK